MYFDLRGVVTPLECAHPSPSTAHDCDNPEVVSPDLVITKLKLEVGLSFGRCPASHVHGRDPPAIIIISYFLIKFRIYCIACSNNICTDPRDRNIRINLQLPKGGREIKIWRRTFTLECISIPPSNSASLQPYAQVDNRFGPYGRCNICENHTDHHGHNNCTNGKYICGCGSYGRVSAYPRGICWFDCTHPGHILV